MQQNPSSQNAQKEKKGSNRRELILRKVRALLLENWGTKLLALIIAVALWAGLITQDPTLTREKQFTDVSVTVNGEETLKKYGYIILEDFDKLLDNVTVRVSVPQGQYTAAQANNYSVRLELSRIRQAGEQEVKIMSTNSSTYGTVTEIDPPTVKVTVDEYVTRYRIPVMVTAEGTPPAGFYAAAPSTDPPVIAVSGPKTLVDRIISAQVVADQTAVPAQEGAVRRALPFTLVDKDGKVIDSSMLEVTSESVLLDSIIVEQMIYTQRTVEVADMGLVKGKPAEGYEVKGVYITPSNITVAGRAAIIDAISLLYADSSVDITGLTESMNKSIRVRQPSTLKYVSTDQVTVAVEIGPIITTRAYEVPVEVQGLNDMLAVSGGSYSATVYLAGAQNWLNSVSIGDLSVTCDMSSVAEPGEYTLPLACTVKGSEDQAFACEVVPSSVTVTVTTK